MKFSIGDLVKVDPSELVAGDMGEEASGMLVVNEYAGTWQGMNQYELKNSEGDAMVILENALVAL
jgi:hypothetical protein